jgi:hypothetical protein
MSSIGSPRDYFADHPVSGPAYATLHKASATAILIGIVFYAFRALEAGHDWMTLELKFVFALIGLALLFSYRALLQSTTTVDGDGIGQSAMNKRASQWGEISGVRVVRVPLGARMTVRTRDGRVVTYHGASEDVCAAFALVSRRYPPA